MGAVAALAPDDVVAPGRREAGAALPAGSPPRACSRSSSATPTIRARAAAPRLPGLPRALNVLPASAHAATQLPQATGVAWAMKMKRTVALAFLDAAETSAEDFHAGLNFAGVYRVPVIFVCINDRPLHRPPRTMSETFAVKALAYGIAGVRVDGGDFFAVLSATRAAAENAGAGGGATLIEAVVPDDARSATPSRASAPGWPAEKMLDETAEAAQRVEVEPERRAASLPRSRRTAAVDRARRAGPGSSVGRAGRAAGRVHRARGR